MGFEKLEQNENKIELANGVFFNIKEKSSGVYEITDLGKNGESFKGMMLGVIEMREGIKDEEGLEHKQWEQSAGSYINFSYKDVRFDFVNGGGEIYAPSLRAIEEAIADLKIELIDPEDRDY